MQQTKRHEKAFNMAYESWKKTAQDARMKLKGFHVAEEQGKVKEGIKVLVLEISIIFFFFKEFLQKEFKIAYNPMSLANWKIIFLCFWISGGVHFGIKACF